MNKAGLVGAVSGAFREGGFLVCECSGTHSCFDVLARRGGDIFLVKVLSNIEGLTSRNSLELTRVASLLSATPLVVGDRMKSHRLEDGVLYDRYGISVVNPQTFNGLLSDAPPSRYAIRGNYCARINPRVLSRIRQMHSLTQAQLAELLGVSKQSVYRYESSGRVSVSVAERLFELFGGDELRMFEDLFSRHFEESVECELEGYVTHLKRSVEQAFEDIGFSATITNAPFDMVVKSPDDETLFTAVSNDWQRLGRKMNVVEDVSEIVGGYSVCITERRVDVDSPVLNPRELRKYRRPGELMSALFR